VFAWFAWRHYASFDWSRFAQSFEILQPGWLVLGVALALASFLGRAVRWQVMMLPVHSSFWSIAFATYVGFSAIVIFGRTGELVRPFLIARREKTALATQAAIWALERFYDFPVLLLLFGIGFAHARQLGVALPLQFLLQISSWTALGCVLLTGAIFYLMVRKPEFCRKRLGDATSFLPREHHARLVRSLNSFLNALRPAGDWPILFKSLVLTAAEWALIFGAVWSYFHAFPPASSFSILDIAAYFGFTAFGAVFQLPGIGGGMQIASIVILTELFHMSVEQATGLSLLIWAGTSMIVLPFGIPLALYRGLSLGKLRAMGREARL
jgi:glycosyltransferase 2 family protein